MCCKIECASSLAPTTKSTEKVPKLPHLHLMIELNKDKEYVLLSFLFICRLNWTCILWWIEVIVLFRYSAYIFINPCICAAKSSSPLMTGKQKVAPLFAGAVVLPAAVQMNSSTLHAGKKEPTRPKARRRSPSRTQTIAENPVSRSFLRLFLEPWTNYLLPHMRQITLTKIYMWMPNTASFPLPFSAKHAAAWSNMRRLRFCFCAEGAVRTEAAVSRDFLTATTRRWINRSAAPRAGAGRGRPKCRRLRIRVGTRKKGHILLYRFYALHGSMHTVWHRRSTWWLCLICAQYVILRLQ